MWEFVQFGVTILCLAGSYSLYKNITMKEDAYTFAKTSFVTFTGVAAVGVLTSVLAEHTSYELPVCRVESALKKVQEVISEAQEGNNEVLARLAQQTASIRALSEINEIIAE